jgi:hypothetical protein
VSSVDDTNPRPIAAGDVIAGRYRVEDQLGRGGMAHVLRVRDVSTGRELALKRLVQGGSDASAAPFAREYYTLRQLAHPSIIEVYDYGFDGDTPYYTMELLSGHDLGTGVPFAWPRAARLLMSVASSLAVLHSRRLIHRDVTATNVRCTHDDSAKLIDFGAMVEMGAARPAVGTVPYLAPEALNQQALDQRLDLYALGALAYLMLTGRDAYPARHVAQLRELWSMPLMAASALQPELPEPFSRLVASLLELEPWARPSSAAEVMERLSAIAGLPLTETAAVRQAYLTTPRLVGRDREVAGLRSHAFSAGMGHGGALLVRGPTGIGRSRLLDACVLEAKLTGLVVLRADASDGREFAATRALLEQLWAALPAERAAAPPELAQLGSVQVTDARRPQLQAALQAWLLSLADRHGLLLAVDDLQAVDEPSAALLALLASQAVQHRLLIATTLADDVTVTSPRPTALLTGIAASITVPPLSAAETEQLLRSVFGSVPRIRLLADRLHARSEGNPSALMELGQHLVSTGVVRYEGGAWLIPERFAAEALPERVDQALRARFSALGPEAHRLAETLASCQDLTLDAEAYAKLAGLPDQASYHAALDALSAAGVLSNVGAQPVFRHAAFAVWLRESTEPERARELHGRIAALLDEHGDQPLRAAMHFSAAGADARSLDAAIALATRWLNRDRASSPESRDAQLVLADAFPRMLEAGLSSLETYPRPARARYYLLLALAYAALYGRPELMKRYLAQIIERLCLDSGLHDFVEWGDTADQTERLRGALARARARHDAASEDARVFAPAEAIKFLTRLVHSVIGVAASTYDHDLLDALPVLDPLLPLSAALAIAVQNVSAARAMIAGRHLASVQTYERMLARLDGPDLADHEPTLHRYVRLAFVYACAHNEAGLGIASALERAEELRSDPLHELNALRVQGSYYLSQGDALRAEACRQQVELLEIQNAPLQFFEGHDAFRYLPAYAALDDLPNVKRMCDTIEALAKRHAGWLAVRHYAAGEYARIRGDHAAALCCFGEALQHSAAGRDQVWPRAAEQYLYALVALGRASEAEALGRAWTETWEQHELVGAVGVAQAFCEAAIGAYVAALARLDAIIARWNAAGMRGVQLGRAYELAARIARQAGEGDLFERYAAQCRELYTVFDTPALLARYRRLYEEQSLPEPVASDCDR